MYEFIIGKIEYKSSDYFVISANNIGYKIISSITTISSLELGSVNKVYIDMVVREDDISLYGFSTIKEREVYRLLTKVKGIGPKIAIGVLSGISTDSIILAIRNNDVNTLLKAPGVGKKTAERIILELKDKTDGITLDGNAVSNNTLNDAKDALVQLGYSNFEISDLLDSIYEEGMTVEELIKLGLKQMTR